MANPHAVLGLGVDSPPGVRRRGHSVELRESGDRLARFIALLFVDLWVLEGAIRKWVPGTDQVFYVARDAIAVLALVALLLLPKQRARSAGWFWAIAAALMIVGSLQVLAELVPPLVMILGLRSYLAPLLLLAICFMHPTAVTAQDLARRLLFYLPLQAALAVAQVLSPVSSWINSQVIEGETQFESAGVVRVMGTFTTPAGFVLFATLAFAISLAWVVDGGVRRRWALFALIATVLVGVISGSRAMVLNYSIIIAMLAILVVARGTARLVKALVAVAAVVIAVLAVATLWFQDVLDAFVYRFEGAARAEDTAARLVRRSLGYLSADFDLKGNGMGAHSQAGIAVGSPAAWIEVETMRWVSELGVLGFVLALAMTIVAVLLVLRVILKARRLTALHALVTAALVPVLLSGHITQTPYAQGFVAICAAMLFLSWRERETETRPRGAKSLVG